MHGPTHNAGGVASIQNIKNPSKLLLAMERTDHVIIVGEGALKFARLTASKRRKYSYR
ncbi:MAG: isoaspartyl peptidase/L-asparaginase [Ignavibacteriales bacterium]|nr:isoaspartyl peptidase/L-asparaginase [Ignavibacteriales bacterium]